MLTLALLFFAAVMATVKGWRTGLLVVASYFAVVLACATVRDGFDTGAFAWVVLAAWALYELAEAWERTI